MRFPRRLGRRLLGIVRILTPLWLTTPGAAEPLTVVVDFAHPAGQIRPLHGINKGPLGPGGLLDLTREQRALGVPLTRLHDCYWPNPYVVDIHAVFPNPEADPAHPESYDFRLTDEYLAAVRATGAGILYRLGESIEHTRVKRYAHPPADIEKWAAICLGIVRHYNEGWADGFHHDIRYWEIWNEPENRPAMWSGSDEEYLRLYAVTSKALKQAFPRLKVGGPAVGASGHFSGEDFRPTEFVQKFLRHCRTESLPLEFFSWHCYTADPSEPARRARAIRRLLDDRGFPRTESHLNEWNYLPGNTWEPGAVSSPAINRQQYYESMSGAAGAAFIASTLMQLQDAPLDMANLFHGEAGIFGLFNEFGVPQKSYHALLAFHELLATPRRTSVDTVPSGTPGLTLLAGVNLEQNRAGLLLSSVAETNLTLQVELRHLPWTGSTTMEIRRVDERHTLESGDSRILTPDQPTVALQLRSPGITLLTLRPEPAPSGASLEILQPGTRVVFQRNLENQATIPVSGKTSQTGADAGAGVEGRLVLAGDGRRDPPWTHLADLSTNGTFAGELVAPAGWYELQVRVVSGTAIRASAVVPRVGVGEVFVVVGHSVAQGGDLNLPGATDDRVNTVALRAKSSEDVRNYERTGSPEFLPPLVGSHFATGIAPAPFGHGTYFWARFGELLVEREQVPVMIFNAAFGGTSLAHWAKSARGEPFEHSFVRSDLRMPYVNLRHTLQRYVTVTGVRALLSDQGQNDADEPDSGIVFQNYRTWVEQARADLDAPELPVVINRQTPYLQRTSVRRAQERMIREVPHCYPGPDYDSLRASDRTDGIHLSAAGTAVAAQRWVDALDTAFLRQTLPYLPKRRKAPATPTKIQP